MCTSGDQAEVFSLEGDSLPLWDEALWNGTPEWPEHLAPQRQLLRAYAEALEPVHSSGVTVHNKLDFGM
ncbi:MAG: hypothetical protein DSZ00_09985 [Gammaproteobacteria bacterium]|nr:MAG: hypothetical protein DSZ00_09985 [Gammaproteobacteria bacterium]RTZ76009.1 MAG: hypothetical protein DSZ02_02165 [Gammaproteobacteria bacterium]RTZ76994.1 MAG: hypothetical protein DSZ01_07455 [Gammaproteobacteria bacterium]